MIDKMTWVSPKTQIQQFAANDRVSACIRLTCMLPTESNKNGQYSEALGKDNGSYYSRAEDQWKYYEGGLSFHREHECGDGASLRPGENHEYGHTDAIIQSVWLDGYTLSNGTIVKNGDANGQFDDSEWFDPSTLQENTVFSSNVSSIFAKWTTLLNNILYTHIGIASINNRRNHS